MGINNPYTPSISQGVKAMTQDKQCNCYEHEGDNPQCPIHHPKPKQEEKKQGEQE